MYDTVKRRIERYLTNKGKQCKVENIEEAKTIISLQELMTYDEQDELDIATSHLSTKLFNNAHNVIYWYNKNLIDWYNKNTKI